MLIQQFIDYLKVEKGYSPHTRLAYSKDLKDFQQFLNDNEQRKIEKAEYSDIRSWILALLELGNDNRSINRKISSLKTFYKFLLKTQQIKISPLEAHKSLKTSKKIILPFSQAEMEYVKEQYQSLPIDFSQMTEELVIELLYTTGMRRSELLQLKINEIDFSQNQIKVLGKRNKERIIPLLPTIIPKLKNYIQYCKQYFTDTTPLLLRNRNGKPLSVSSVYRIVKNSTRFSSKEKRSPHVLRHAFATHLLDEGSDLNTVKELLGHSSLASTQVYTNISIERLKEVHRKAHPRNKKFN